MKKLSILLSLAISLVAIASSASASCYPYAYWNVTNGGPYAYISPNYFSSCYVGVFFQNYTLAPQYNCGGIDEGEISGGACQQKPDGDVYMSLKPNESYYAWITCQNGTEHWSSYKSSFYFTGANDTIVNVENISLYKLTDWDAQLTIPDTTMIGNSTNNVLIWNRRGNTFPVVGNGGNYEQLSETDLNPAGTTFDQYDPYDAANIACNPIIINDFNPNWHDTTWCGSQTIYGYLYDSYSDDRRAPANGTQTFTITNCTVPVITTTTINTTTTSLPNQGVNQTFLDPVFPIDADEWNAAGYGWLLPFFSVFFLSTMLMIVIVAGAGMVGGPVGGGVAALGMLIVYSVLGIYPMWIALLIGLVGAAIVAKLVMGAVSK